MQKFTKLSGIAAPMPLVNIDTDMIIPKQFLKTIQRSGLGKNLFDEMRYTQDGQEIPDFVLNQPAYRNAQILVAGDNFGCGSSREHAPRALLGAGVSCVVAESFARIFFRNAINIGLPVVEASIEAAEGETISVDLESGRIVVESSGKVYQFKSYPPFITMLVEKGGLIPYTKEMLQCRE